jgi:hypothetical protein
VKTSIAMLTLCGALGAVPAWAQTPTPGDAPATAAPAKPKPSGGPGATAVASGEKKGPAFETVDSYLLKKENSPFMVMAKVFRGPDAEKMALALSQERRNDFGLPAYILRTKDFAAGRNLVANNPGALQVHEEAAVLVGDEKTAAATEILVKKLKKIEPKCVAHYPRAPLDRLGRVGTLHRAIRTTNPYVTARELAGFRRVPERGGDGPR